MNSHVKADQGASQARLRADGADDLCATGEWTLRRLDGLELDLAAIRLGSASKLDASGISMLDSAGAWYLARLQRERGVRIEGLTPEHNALLELIAPYPTEVPAPAGAEPRLQALGRSGVQASADAFLFLSFVGQSLLRLLAALARPWRIRWNEVVADIRTSGVNALLIVGLLSFLMGVVIAYQGAVQLRLYGANIYVADLVGLSLLRELSPLLAAIIVAGRTGSAYAAQIGTMQVTEEVAALRTIGVEPIDLLVLPKLISQIIALPLLAVFADITGVFGGMLMAKLQLGLGFAPFIDRFAEAVSMRSFLLGLSKAPVFALVIALVGCYQGFRVQGGAQSVGRHTTMAVVQAIFLVIVVDAVFSVLFSWLGI